jgi:regulation of enolase protein 1 (concanavalin A-like superfamily)
MSFSCSGVMVSIDYDNWGRYPYCNLQAVRSAKQIIRRLMNNWSAEEMAFRCDQLLTRIDRLTQHILNIGSLSKEGTEPEATLVIIRQTKAFIELTVIDTLAMFCWHNVINTS